MTTNKTPKTEEKKPKERATKARAEKRKSKAATSDEDMADVGEPEPEEKPLDPLEARKAREKEGEHIGYELLMSLINLSSFPSTQATKGISCPRPGATGRRNATNGHLHQEA